MASSQSQWFEYLDLLSTASLDEFPENTNSDFHNQLAIPQILPPNAYCALVEMGYQNCFFNIEADKCNLTIFDPLYEHKPGSKFNPTETSHGHSLWGKFTDVSLDEGYYKSMDEICQMLNKAIQSIGCASFDGKSVFSYNSRTMRVHFDMKDIQATVMIKGRLLNLLGVETREASDAQNVKIGIPKDGMFYEVPFKDSSIPAERRWYLDTKWHFTTVDEKIGKFAHAAQLTTLNNMVVYASHISSQVYGNSFANVLRVIPIKANQYTGQQVVVEFKNPHYLRCQQSYIKNIHILIKDIAGSDLKFRQGSVRIKLHFIVRP